MQTKSKITQYNLNKQSKKASLYNNIYKLVLYSLTVFCAIIILFSIFIVLKGGINVIQENDVPLSDWLFGTVYSPVAGLVCGAVIIINTLWMALLAVGLAAPISIGTALIITRTLKGRSSAIVFSVVAILAAVPSVIYGALGYYVLDKFSTQILGYDRASLFTVVIMVSLMIMPTITIMTTASIRLTDTKLEDSSYALGASRTQTSFYVTLKAAKTGIYTGIIFAVGRCIAETTAISMVGSPTSLNDGFTLVWWKQSLFLGPAILTANTSEIVPKYPVVPIISMLMITTTLSLFAIMKIVEYRSDESFIIRKQTNIYVKERDVVNKYEKLGIEGLDSKEQNILISIEKRKQWLLEQIEINNRPKVHAQVLLQNSSVSSTKRYEQYKNSKSLMHNAFIYGMASIGIILLFTIISYLLIGGFEWLSWDYLTMRGRQLIYDENAANGSYYDVIGLAVPIMGTYISMILSVSIAMPIGVLLGVCLSTYLSKERKIGWFVSFVFQALTAIPGIIWATFSTTILISTGLYKNHIGLVPIIFMIFIILPSIIKSVEEAGGRVKKSLKEGSYALGATTATTTRRIYFNEVFPSIVSGTLLAMSIAMAESTIFIYIISVHSTPTDASSWINDGGYTLSTLIFTLKSRNVVWFPESRNQIKTIGIILMIIILSISYTSTLVNRRKFFEASLMGVAILSFPLGVYINEGSELIILFTIVCALFALFIAPFIVKYKEERYADIIRSRSVKPSVESNKSKGLSKA